jgi:hypothetical protein
LLLLGELQAKRLVGSSHKPSRLCWTTWNFPKQERGDNPSAARRSWDPSWRQAGIPCGVAEGGRTRGFAAPAFAGCAFIADATELGAGAGPVKHRLQGETTLS